MSDSNGHRTGTRLDDGKVRVAIVGVGNCANSLLQGVEYYKDAPDDQFVPGLMHVNLGGYHVRDIEFTAAFDVVKGKVGEDLADAMWAHPNDTIKFADVPKTGVKVSRGMTHDGLGKYLSQIVEKAPGETDDIVGILKETKTDVVVSYLPVGSEAATKWYAEQMPRGRLSRSSTACPSSSRARTTGASASRRRACRSSATTSSRRSARRSRTASSRASSASAASTSTRRCSSTSAATPTSSTCSRGSGSSRRRSRRRTPSRRCSTTTSAPGNVHVGPSDYVPWLTDRKWAYIRMEGSCVRRRAAQRRAQARGLGLAELGRHRHRRRPAGEARAQQRRRRRARRPELVPHEVAAAADRRRRGVRADRGVHQEERAQGRGGRRKAPTK